MGHHYQYIERITPELPRDIIACGPGDVHLGAPNRSAALLELMEGVESPRIIFNGDLFDNSRFERLTEHDIRFLELMERKRQQGTDLVYILGNHDWFFGRLESGWPFVSSSWKTCNEYLLEYRGKKYYFVHGDQFDRWARKWRKLDKYAGGMYQLFKRLDGRMTNDLKVQSKKLMRTSRVVKNGVAALARGRDAEFAFAGHTHLALTEKVGPTQYMNVGAFVDRQCGFFTIDAQGVPRLHIVTTRKRRRAGQAAPVEHAEAYEGFLAGEPAYAP